MAGDQGDEGDGAAEFLVAAPGQLQDVLAVTGGDPATAERSGDAGPPRIRHLLFDADGVIQSIPGGWYTAIEPYVGERAREFLHGAWKQELPMLAGQGDYLPLLAARLTEFGVSAPVEEV